MKKLFLIMVAVMATLSVKAQIVKNLEYPRGHFGIRAAYTSNTYTLDRGYDEAFEGGAKSFVSGGLAADFRVASIPLYLETGAYYINRGYKGFEYDGRYGISEGEYDNHSVMVPLLMSYHLYFTDNMAIQPFVGPFVEYGIDAEEVSAGIRAGVGYNFGRLYVNVGYDFGFNIDDKKNNTFFATIGFNFAGSY